MKYGKVKILEIDRLPYTQGLYFAVANKQVLYVDYDLCLPNLLRGKDIFNEIFYRYEIKGLIIYWIELDPRKLLEAKQHAISLLNPIFN